MSYILEALKKSQSDRELGHVPRVEGFGVDVPIEGPRSHPWAYLGLLVGLAAAGTVGLVVLRALSDAPPAGIAAESTTQAPPASSTGAPRAAEPAAAARAAAAGRGDGAAGGEPASARPGFLDPAATPQPPPELAARQAAAETAETAVGQRTAAVPQAPETRGPASPPDPAAQAGDGPAAAESTIPHRVSAAADTQSTRGTPAGAGTTDPAGPLDTPDSLSVEPQVLVVPAPGRPGEPLPRGAEELRRAVLGDGGRVSASVDSPSGDSESLPRPPAPGEPLSDSRPDSERAPVPDDVLAEIEAFKELVRKRDPDALKRAAAEPPPLPEPPGLQALRPEPQAMARPARPSLDLRNRLPPFSMTVHVYNDDPQRRFVYINDRKITEGQKSREGIRLEQVVADGAVLSYQGESFFQQR
jgi:general secretion pathway protein B